MTDLTDEAVKALLGGAMPGPWRADGEPWNRIVWSSADNRICFMSHSNGLNDERDVASSNLAAAAPDLARALLDARADTEAAVALTLEEADKHITAIEKLALSASIASCTCNIKTPDISFHSANCRYVKLEYIIAQCEDFRAFVPASGVAKLAELRAEIERLQGLVSASEAHRYRVCGELLAERDRLATELAAANAREAGLRDLNERLVASLAAAVEGPWDHAKDMPLALTAIADSAALAQSSTEEGGA